MSRRRLRALTLATVVMFTAGIGVVAWGVAAFNAPGLSVTDRTVVLPRGASVTRIATILEAEGILAEPLFFQFAVRLSGQSNELKAGEYLIPAASTMRDVVVLLSSGKTVVRRLTIAEGLSVAEALSVIDRADGLTGSVPDSIAEGSLLPETYHYSYGDSREEIVARMQKALRDELERLWAERAEGLPLDSPQDALVLASIVEKETAIPTERARIAGVFVNRLKRGMRLQSDPTVVYAIARGTPLGRRLTREDLAIDSPYNTYRVSGLPPLPIANPGKASLAAVLRPDETNELYFVADGSGGHAFAETLVEHQRNVRRWRRLRDGQD